MNVQIAPYDARQIEAIVRLSLRAWAPVFESIRESMDIEIYREFYPDWRVSQQKAVEDVCAASDTNVWVAIDAESAVGFVAVKLHSATMGEVYMVAVDPDYHRQGIGTALMHFALEWMKSSGVAIAMVETGCDPGHGPARRMYEELGFGLFPVARYFKKL